MSDKNVSTRSMRQRGFTLIELMIVVVIAAILVGIAVPSYTSQVRKSRRTDARNALMDIAAREERFLSVTNAYSQTPSDIGWSGPAWPQTLVNQYYTVKVEVPNPNTPAVANSFLITATTAGIQVGDTACTTFTVNQIGPQKALDSGGANADATCWGN
jgi:type IV pilus assembly protein PilE